MRHVRFPHTRAQAKEPAQYPAFRIVFAGCLLLSGGAGAATIPDMDSARGEQVFVSGGCIQCHELNGRGGHDGPNLLRVLDRAFTPGELTAAMWNHAPTMWSKMAERNVTVYRLTTDNAADLLALLYASRFFEKAGDAARGKELFTEKRCAQCHGITTPVNPKAKPLALWQGLADPVSLVSAKR
jgi:mono/diheme cytochrome c family protein